MRIAFTIVLAGLIAGVTGTGALAGEQPSSSHQERYQFCMVESGLNCHEKFYGGDLPRARFQELGGLRPKVRLCVKDPKGTRRFKRRRPSKRFDIMFWSINPRVVGKHVTTWRVKGKVVGRWRWRFLPEPE